MIKISLSIYIHTKSNLECLKPYVTEAEATQLDTEGLKGASAITLAIVIATAHDF